MSRTLSVPLRPARHAARFARDKWSAKAFPSWVGGRRARVASLSALLALTALLYLVGLSASGYANEFYAAAAQAGSTDWWSFLWGSSDAGNSITVDKPPASLWVMALSIRVFGLSSWSLLVPQAIMGVLSVLVLYRAVSRDFGHWCGMLAGLFLATTPIACLMFRFDNPDALLVLLMVASADCVLKAAGLGRDGLLDDRGWCADRAANRARTRWMAVAGVLMGLAFLTKQLQAFLVLPGFALAFLVASPTRLRRRILDSAVALGAMTLAAGWWVLLTVVVPADARPYIGGSETNSFVELTFWYNGLGRIFGNTVGNGSMAAQGILMGTGGEAGLARLLSGEWGTQWSWLFPAALAGSAATIVASGKRGRLDARRAQALLWSAWLVVTFLVFSYMEGTIHQYYTVALAPAVAALAAMGVRVVWERRDKVWARAAGAAALVCTAAWACILVSRTSWHTSLLSTLAAAVAAGSLVALAVCEVARRRGAAAPCQARLACVVLAVSSMLVVPVAHSVYTASQGHHGSIVTAGPEVEGSDVRGGGGPGGAGGGMGSSAGGGMGSSADGGMRGGSAPDGDGASAGGAPSDGGAPSGGSAPSDGGAPSGGTPGGAAPAGGDGDGSQPTLPDGQSANAPSGQGGDGAPSGTSMLGGQGDAVSEEVQALLLEDADAYTWVAAAVGSQSAAGYQLATERAVMPIGGFNGTDPSPTLEQFKSYVEEGRIHYFIAGGQGSGRGGSSSSGDIASWVAENFEEVTVDGVTLYDLTSPLSS